MSTVDLSGTIADPEKVGRCVVVFALTLDWSLVVANGLRLGSIGVLEVSSHGLFILKQEALMAGIQVDGLKLSRGISTNSMHEPKRLRDGRDNL